jgi:hypothetical protein
MVEEKVCPFMSTPRQGDTVTFGEPLYKDDAEIEEYGYTLINGKIWSGIFPCLREKCTAWNNGLVKLSGYGEDFCKGCSIWKPDKTCTEWKNGSCPEYEEAHCMRVRLGEY